MSAVLGEAAEGTEKDQNRRVRHGLGSVPCGYARHSTSATIADRRSRAAIVVPRSSLAPSRRGQGTPAISASLIVAAFLGFLLVVFLIIHSGAAEVASAMLALGWWLAPITLYHLLPLYFDAASWRELFPAANRPGRLSFLWMRWIRESVSTLLAGRGCRRRRRRRAARASARRFGRAGHRQHGGRCYSRLGDPTRLRPRRRGAAHRRQNPRRGRDRMGTHDRRQPYSR